MARHGRDSAHVATHIVRLVLSASLFALCLGVLPVRAQSTTVYPADDVHHHSAPVSISTSQPTVENGSARGPWVWRNPLPQGNDLYSVACPTQAACVAVGLSGTIISSSDGGVTWSSRTSGTQNGLTGVACPSASECLAVGKNGTIMVSTRRRQYVEESERRQPE